jgi:hypothetical protein
MLARAVVRGGRLIVDEPTELPEGTVLDLVIDDEGDDLSPKERAQLDARLDRALAQADAGSTVDAGEVFARMHRQR